MLFSTRLDWSREGRTWPNREASRFVAAGGIRWHVQVMGQGPVLLLVHGTGAATHSWRDLAPLLASRYTLVMPDLPGHGFSDPLPRPTLPEMARALAALVKALGLPPAAAVGHSAGAAILARAALDGGIGPGAIIALNGAFLPFREGQGEFFSGLAKLLVMNPFVPRIFSLTASDPRSVEKLVRDTGSRIDKPGLELYRRLLRQPAHVQGALAMMANWDLHPLLRDLPRLPCRLVLVAAGADKAIPPSQAHRVHGLVPGSVVEPLPGLGHLAHEEAPQLVAGLIEHCVGSAGSGIVGA